MNSSKVEGLKMRRAADNSFSTRSAVVKIDCGCKVEGLLGVSKGRE